MSLNKAIEHKKEKRKKYYGSKAFCRSCRNHGGCPICEQNRKHKFIKIEKVFEEKEKEYLTNKE